MPPPGTPAPNETSGKQLQSALGSDVIQINSDELRGVAVAMQGQAYELEQLKSDCGKINEAAERQAAEFTEDRQPAPIYGETVTALKTVGTRIEEEIDKIIKQLKHDAAGLMWVADQHDANEEHNASSVNKIDTSGTGGSGGGLTSPNLSPPAPGTGPQIPPVPPGGFPSNPNATPPPIDPS
jgi:hypothetical protein